MTTPADDRLRYLMSGYFHQDWDVVSGPDWSDVIDDVIATESEDVRREIAAELSGLLDSGASDEQLAGHIEQAGGSYMVTASEARGWLIQVRRRLLAASDPENS
jgi:hypothetical protein